MHLIGVPTPRPEVPLEGAEMIIPVVCIGLFFAAVFGLFMWFFCFMHSERKEDLEKQDEMYKDRYLKKAASYYTNRSDGLFPKTYGASAWRSWKEETPDAPKESAGQTSDSPHDDP